MGDDPIDPSESDLSLGDRGLLLLGTNHCASGSPSPSPAPISANTTLPSLADLTIAGRMGGVLGVGGALLSPPPTAPAPAPAALLMLLALRCGLGSLDLALARAAAARTACSADVLCARRRTRSSRKEAPYTGFNRTAAGGRERDFSRTAVGTSVPPIPPPQPPLPPPASGMPRRRVHRRQMRHPSAVRRRSRAAWGGK